MAEYEVEELAGEGCESGWWVVGYFVGDMRVCVPDVSGYEAKNDED